MSAVSGNALTATFRIEHALRRRRILLQLLRRAPRTTHEFAGAVRAPAVQRFGAAACAERAFEGTDEGAVRVSRKIGVAAFAIRPQLQHVSAPLREIPGPHG